MKKTYLFAILLLLIASSKPEAAASTIRGPKGLISIPTAEALEYKEVGLAYDYLIGATPSQDEWLYKLNLGTFQNWEIGAVGGKYPAEGVFIHAKYHLMSDNTRFPLSIAIGVENLTSKDKTDLYMVASKKFKGGLNTHVGFKANFGKGSVNPSIMGGAEYFVSNEFSLLGDIDGQQNTYMLNGGAAFNLNGDLSVRAAVLDALNSSGTGVAYAIGVAYTKFI